MFKNYAEDTQISSEPMDNLNHKTLNHIPQTIVRQPQTINHKHQTINHTPQTIPKPQTIITILVLSSIDKFDSLRLQFQTYWYKI